MGNGNEDDSSVAQWARDPSGRHVFRYWDGTRWTGHVSDSRTMPVDAPKELAQHPGTPPPRPPGPPRAGESGPHTPVSTPAATAPAATATTTEVADAHPETHARSHRRQTARRRRAFLLGLVTGVALVAAAGAAAYAILNPKITTGSSSNASRHRSTTSTSVTPTSLATTTTANPGRPAQQVHVRVINASAVPNAASMKSFALGQLGYPVTGLADAAVQTGTFVQCKPGFEAEAATLAKNVGQGATVQPFPSPTPAGSANADCLVILGK